MMLSKTAESPVITDLRNRRIERLYKAFKEANTPERQLQLAKCLVREYRDKYPKFNSDKDENVEWITVRGAHIPIDDNGNATGGPLKGRNFSDAKSEKTSSSSEKESKSASSKPAIPANHDAKKKFPKSVHWSTPLVIDTPEARNMYVCIKEKDYFTMEEMENSPVLDMLEGVVKKWDAKFGITADINTPERQQKRDEWEGEFLSTGSAVVVGKDENGRDKYEFTGKIKKEFKAEVVIGLPASGKSSGIANPDSKKMGAFIFDSDEVKKLITEFKESDGGAANAVHKESKNILAKAFARFQDGGDRHGDNLIIPVIGDSYADTWRKWVEPLEKAGYKVNVKYQDANPEKSLNHNIMRAIESGRVIPKKVALGYEDKPRAAFEEFKKNGYAE